MSSPTFLNLDLELKSEEDLEPLAAHLDKYASLLYMGEREGLFLLIAEPASGGLPGVSAEACTEEMLNTIESLPEHLLALFRGSRQRLFDYGFESGSGSKPCLAELPAAQLERMSRLGLGLRVTVYQQPEEPRGVDA